MIQVTVNEQKSEARLTITPDPDTDQVTSDQLIAALKQNNVVFGISRKQLFALRDRFNQNPAQEISAVIARSQAPEATSQPTCNFYFRRQRLSSHMTGNDKDQVDHKDKGITRYFKPGNPLLVVNPGRPGKAGHLIDGTTISPEPLKNIPTYRAGSGVTLEKGTEKFIYRAAVAGQAHLDQHHTISISTTFHHDGDIDMETGHIEFAGPVTVNGCLRAGFHIFSNADINITKTVSGTIKTRGNLKVDGGIIGSEQEQILVGGQLSCEYISGCVKLHAGKQLLVGKHIINSILLCDDRIICNENITGECQISAFLGLTCDELGSEQGSQATIKIGDFTKHREKLAKIEEYLEPLIQESIAMVDQLGLQVLMQKDVSGLPPEKQPEAKKILQRYLEIDDQVNRLKIKKSDLEKKIEAGLSGRVIVKKFAHPGNLIIIGLENYTIKTGLSGPIEFYFDPQHKTITFERIT